MDSRRASYLSLAAILLLATLIQSVLLVRLPTISADGIIFIDIARDLAQAPLETIQTEDQHPGYPALLLAGTELVRRVGYAAHPDAWIAGGVLVSFVCGLLSVAVVWFFARDLFDVRLANVAAIVFAVLPVPRASAVDAQSDTPHALFYLLAAWMATTGISSGNLWRLAAAGAASGVAFWIRPEGLEVALLAVPFLIWQAWRSDWPWARRVTALGALAGAALLIVAPYPILTGKITSKQLPGATAQIARIAEQFSSDDGELPDSAATDVPADGAQTAPIIEPAQPPPTEEPAAVVSTEPQQQTAPPPNAAPPRLEARSGDDRLAFAPIAAKFGKAIEAFINSISQGLKFVFIPAYLLSTVALAWRRPPGIQIAFVALLGTLHIAILIALHVHAGYIAHRHVIPLVGLAAPFVALGTWQISEWMAKRLRVGSARVLPAVVAVCCLAVLPYTLRQLNREFVPVIEATRWVESRAGDNSGIVCNSPYVPFYAQLPVAELGPTAPTLAAALARTSDPARFDFAVLHVGAHAYRDQWWDQLAEAYQPVMELPVANASGRPAKVVVFRARQRGVRQATRPD